MGLKRRTKRHHNNTPICFAHLDKCNGIVLACWRSTLPTYGAGKSPVFFSPSCEPASCRLLLPFLQLSGVPLAECRFPGPATRRLGRLRRESERSTPNGRAKTLCGGGGGGGGGAGNPPNYLRQADPESGEV